MTLASPKFRRPRKPYRPRKTAPCYLLSCACSLLGNSVAGVILPLVLLATTGDALAAGTLALICAVPQFVIGLIGGALTDRFNRRNVSIVSDILSAASVALLPVVDMVWGLSFGWFVALGLLGAIGDIPGMTARDSLVPAVCERDGRSLQKFMGLTQSLDSLVVIVGPALAAFLMGAAGSVNALWFTAAMSLSAALITLTLPRSLGAVCGAAAYAANPAATRIGTAGTQPRRSLLPGAWNALRDGVRVLFASDTLLRSSMLISFGVVMVMGSFQGLVLPVHFTAANSPELLGYVLSAMSAGMLASSLGYAPTSCVAAPGTSYRSPAWPWESWGWAFCRRSRCSSRARSCWVFRPAPSRPCSASSSSTAFPPKIEEAPSARRIRSPWPPRPWPSSPPRSSWRAPECPWPPWPSPAAGCSSPCGPSTPTA